MAVGAADTDCSTADEAISFVIGARRSTGFDSPNLRMFSR